jgi:hypothetical protein
MENPAMAAKKTKETFFSLGDRVKIRHSDWCGRIVELRGPLGPGGVQVYGVRVRSKPKPFYTEVLGDQLVLLPAKSKEGEKEKSEQKRDSN